MRLLLPALALALTVPAAHAQKVTLYGTFSPTHFSGVPNGSTYGVNPQPTYTSFWTPNVGGGVTLGLLSIGPAHLGFDVRASTRPGSNGSDLGLGGLKLSGHVPLIPFKPYVQASGGYLRTRNTVNIGSTFGNITNTLSYAAYEILAGVDVSLLPFVDLRAVEVGGGKGYQLQGSPNNGTQVTLFTVSTGVAFHF